MKAVSGVVVVLLAAASVTVLPTEPLGAEAWPVVRGSVGGDPVLWHVAFEHGDGVQLCRLEEADVQVCQPLDGLPLADLRAMAPGTWAEGSTFWLAERLEGAVPTDALKLTSTMSALLVGSRAREERAANEPAVTEAVERVLPEDSRSEPMAEQVLDQELRTWAREHRHDDALFAAFARHRSVGMCSADTTPQRTTRLFAELASARGDLPTFVDLQVQLMANSFERVAWSSLAERGQPTGAQRLLEANVDVDALFLGLLIQHPGAVASLDDWRLARAIREAGRTEALLPRLQALATMESLDPYNRFRATEVWLHLQVYDERTLQNLAAVQARAALLELDPISRRRIDQAR